MIIVDKVLQLVLISFIILYLNKQEEEWLPSCCFYAIVYLKKTSLGAPCQCQSPYFCLISVHSPHFVLLLSCFCLNPVLFLSSVLLLSCFCLSNLSFVLFWTSFCHPPSQYCPTFVPIWSSRSMANGEDKYWTKAGQSYFSIFHLVTLQLDKKGTKVGHQS